MDVVVVLFDLEGTLVQTIEDDQEAIREFRARTREKLVELGIPRSELDGLVGATLMRNKALEYVVKYFNKNKARYFYNEIDKFLRIYELSWADRSKIFTDTLPCLRELRRLGCKMGIVTNTSREAANRELSMHRIKDFFDVVITREDIRKLKPDPEGLLLALRKLNARDFFFVGDLIHDAHAAEKASGTSIIINRTALKKLEFPAHHVVESLKQIPNLI